MASEDIKMTVYGKQQEKFYNITKLFLIVSRSRKSLGPLPFLSFYDYLHPLLGYFWIFILYFGTLVILRYDFFQNCV